MPRVFVSRAIPKIGIELLRKNKFQLKVSPYARALKKKELVKMAKGSDALLCLLTDKIDSSVLDGIGPQLKIVANYAVGYDNIDLAACRKRGIKVSNTPGVLTDGVAEHTLALMLALSKRLVEADHFMRKGKYKGWSPDLLIGKQVGGKVLGIVGLGRIGKKLAQMAVEGFSMKVLYTDRFKDKKFEKKYQARKVGLDFLLKQSDFVTLHVPLLPSTRYLIDEKKIALMKKEAFLINTARGPVVKEKALYSALLKNKIAGAALDVFECEPELTCQKTMRSKVRQLDNLIVTPHIASASFETRSAMSELAAQNIMAYFKGRKLPSEVEVK